MAVRKPLVSTGAAAGGVAAAAGATAAAPSIADCADGAVCADCGRGAAPQLAIANAKVAVRRDGRRARRSRGSCG
jgi:hypothetical protein